MKKIITGCCLTIVGAFSNIALLISISFHVNKLGGWADPPGKFMTALESTGASLLIFPMTIATILLVVGLYLLLEDYLKTLLNRVDK